MLFFEVCLKIYGEGDEIYLEMTAGGSKSSWTLQVNDHNYGVIDEGDFGNSNTFVAVLYFEKTKLKIVN